MLEFAAAYPDQMQDSMGQARDVDVDVDAISDHPNLAGITYSRQQ